MFQFTYISACIQNYILLKKKRLGKVFVTICLKYMRTNNLNAPYKYTRYKKQDEGSIKTKQLKEIFARQGGNN